MSADFTPARRSASLVDVLDRVLDKGLVVAGDIKVSLAEVELVTIRIRLLICSVDKAEQIGLDWWKHDRHFSSMAESLVEKNEELKQRLLLLEERLGSINASSGRSSKTASGQPRKSPKTKKLKQS